MSRDLTKQLRAFIATKGMMLPASEFQMLALISAELDRRIAVLESAVYEQKTAADAFEACWKDAKAALEAEASEGERLREACKAAQASLAMLTEPSEIRSTSVTNAWAQAVAAERLCRVAITPEAPAQRELGSAAANQISTPEVGFPEAPAREGWQPIETAPEAEKVILATRGEYVGEAMMLIDEDTGTQKWTWALGPVHPNHIPLAWRPFPSPPSQDREGE